MTQNSEKKRRRKRASGKKYNKMKRGSGALHQGVSLNIKRRREKTSAEKHKALQKRKWIDLPRDIMFLIFSKLGAVEILNGAQFVCSYWQQLSKEPELFSYVRLLPKECTTTSVRAKAILKEAISRSCGALIEISLEGICCSNWLLQCIAHQARSLKSLCLSSCDRNTNGLVEACSKLPLLEDLKLNDPKFHISREVIERIGRSCSRLKSFWFVQGEWHGCLMHFKFHYDHLAFGIAKTMPQLRSLRLCLTYLTNKGLQAIIDWCPHLEHLDALGCHFNDLEADLKKVCVERFRGIRLPPCKVAPTRRDLLVCADLYTG